MTRRPKIPAVQTGLHNLRCTKCNKQLNQENATISAIWAVHNKNKIDVWVICNTCNSGFNGFLSANDMVFYRQE